MNFFKFKKKNLEKYFFKELKKYDLLSKRCYSNKIKTVLVLLEASQFDEKEVLDQLTEVLGIGKEGIQIVRFMPFDKKQVYAENEITKKDFGWSGSLKLNKLREFVKNEYDLLINYGFEENLYWKVITLQSQSKFKVGFSSLDNRLYDLSVSDTQRSITVLNAEMGKYLKILKKL